jgi:hypothetical protein
MFECYAHEMRIVGKHALNLDRGISAMREQEYKCMVALGGDPAIGSRSCGEPALIQANPRRPASVMHKQTSDFLARAV